MVRVQVDATASVQDGSQVWRLYAAVFDDHPDHDAWTAAVWEPHRTRCGFRLARAHEGDELVGVAYGYTGESGQWWTDTARTVLEQQTAAAWLGGHFELVSIGVLPEARRGGIGRALLRGLLGGLPQPRLLLMTTADPSDPARRLYASEGWEVIGPGIGDHTVIMGRRVDRSGPG